MSDGGNPLLCARTVAGLRAGARDYIVWDRDLAGFGVRVYPSGRKVWVVQSRAGGTPRRLTLGAHGEVPARRARLKAEAAIARIKAGGARAGGGATVAELAARYLAGHVAASCNAHTASIYRGSLDNHILPALGPMPLAEIGRGDVAALHYRLRARPRAANRALAILSKMFSFADLSSCVTSEA